ncbi:hypothetical protein ACNKHS_15405 [Shigella flexneri]
MNKNSVPNDPKSPFVTSGLRIGSPAVLVAALRGGSERAAGWKCDVLDNTMTRWLLSASKVKYWTSAPAFPVYA